MSRTEEKSILGLAKIDASSLSLKSFALYDCIISLEIAFSVTCRGLERYSRSPRKQRQRSLYHEAGRLGPRATRKIDICIGNV